MRPHLIDAVADLSEERLSPGAHANLAAWAAALPSERVTRLENAAARLGAWTLDTPTGTEATATAADIADSVATAIFNVWMVHFVDMAFDDELTLIGERLIDGDTLGRSRDVSLTALAVFERPQDLRSGISAQSDEPILCDDLDTTSAVEGCRLIALMALDAALSYLASAEGLDTSDMSRWRWGTLHTVTLTSLLPSRDLKVPPFGDPAYGGLPKSGDQFSVNNSDLGYDDLDLTQNHGPDLRLLVALGADRPRAKLAFAGGMVFDTFSKHYRDLLDGYWLGDEYFDVPWTSAEIVASAESRWRLR
jgi:penicillin amidase